MDWPTVILIIAAGAGVLALAWLLIFALVARRVTRFQDRVLNQMDPHLTPTWKSTRTTRTYGPRQKREEP